MLSDPQQTTALRKIASLKKRIWGICGGQGAGKTGSILMLLINRAARTPNQTIFIVSAERSKMDISVIKDFVELMRGFKLFEKTEWVGGNLYRFPNGSEIKFFGLDKDDMGKGARSNIIYFNEANKIKSYDTYEQLASRTDRIIIDFNPDKEFWFHDYILNNEAEECDYITLTFKDNEFLKENERNHILGYYKQGYYEDGTVKNEYFANKWRVYGLGQIGRISGAIFQNWILGDFNDELPYAYGLDFGSRDPDALVKVAVDKEKKIIYVKEEIYKNGLSTFELGDRIKSIVPKGKLIIADSAATRTIQDLHSYGINIKSVSKNKIIDDIKLMQNYQIIVDESSTNLITELSNYAWLDKRGEMPMDKYNHAIDAFRYVTQTLVAVQVNRTHTVMIPNRHR